jgi:hypothetical protein
VSIGRAVSIISSITESVFGRAEDNATHEHQEAQARDNRSMVSVAPLPLLTVFVPAVEAASTNINNGTVEDAPTIDEPEARPHAETPTAESNSLSQASPPMDLEESDDESNAGDEGKSDSEGVGDAQDDERQKIWIPPSIEAALAAHAQLDEIINPRRNNGKGHKDPNLDLLLRSHLEGMKRFLWNYTNTASRFYRKWIAASVDTARASEKGPWFARQLREWSSAFINDYEVLPFNVYGTWNKSCLDDEDLRQELSIHLQSIGKYISAMDIVRYLDRPDVKAWHGLKKTITERTAWNWLKKMGYRWKLEPYGQYVDGHEWKDVTDYCQNTFLPKWKDLECCMRAWSEDGKEEPNQNPRPHNQRRVVVWFHDESTFYAHDRRKKRWVHESEKAVPRAKGEGASLMVSDFVSADYGWLRSPDGKESARVLFKAGKNRDGYFTNEDIVRQTEAAMEIVSKYYPDEDHVFVFDNATAHLKRDDTALSARKMTKGPSNTFGVDVTVVNEAGKIRYTADGKPVKKTIQMGPGWLPDGSPQPFYNENGVFKGMTKILQERGMHEESKLRAECKNFKCLEGETRCCQRHVLNNQPDFLDQEPVLEGRCRARGFEVLFLPKFHCELNFIEQC